MANLGGFSPQSGGIAQQFEAHLFMAWLTFSSVLQRWPGLIMFLTSVPLNWWNWTRGRLDFEGARWYPALKLHRSIKWKIIWKGVRTWGSNPGPEHYHSNASPTVPSCLSVNNIIKKHNKTKRVSASFFRARFWTSQSLMATHPSSSLVYFSWKYNKHRQRFLHRSKRHH